MNRQSSNTNHASTSKWFRVAVEGATTDGRSISRDWIAQMAKNYSPTLYGARVNLEHIRGVLPDGPFNAYGDVLALEARDETGEFSGKLGLYAQISPTPSLVSMTKARQKVFTSIEVDPSFADTKQAYLVGLAVTDSPASLGTDILAFSASQVKKGEASPLAARKLGPDNLFTAAAETGIEFELAGEPAVGAAASLFARVSEIIGLAKKKGAADDTRFADMTQAVEALANHGREHAERVASFTAQLDAVRAELATEKKAREASDQAFADLTVKLSMERAGGQRPSVTGQSGTIQTDC
ncbi:GPO family capsid scaffolding protein [Paraburkholderia oxyphila]|uniref:GPO family capsid scaffolding protein n=1 Tax=Paraburkholderia oxyphila TaxID=614212 RepID=UPI00048591B5|nr:GPO family capsid scaffolding protein [Paraburkholderia oxyphila]